MKKTLLTIDEIKLVHQAGNLEEAKRAYLEILDKDPENSTVLHLLGILSVELDDLVGAQDYLEHALRVDADNPSISLHLANVYKANGLFNKALHVLLSLTQSHPNFAAGFNNLGTVYYTQGKLKEAVAAYQSAIALQAEYADAYYNLGLALQKLNYVDEATNAYRALLDLAPNHPGAQFQLGCALMLQLKYKEALNYFINIEAAHPFHFETQVNLASNYLKLGKLNEAKTHYLKALEIIDNDEQVLFNLGIINMQQGNLQDSIKYYLQVAKLNRNSFDAQNNLAIAYLFMKDTQNALLHFREALRIQPQNDAIRHTINILAKEKNVTSSPPQYISALFDSYADHYDAHLTQVLKYHVPELILQAIKKVRDVQNVHWNILDIGCGTGLCGELLKPLAHKLIGIDLSQKMLELAGEKNIYDELIATDILPFLAKQKNAYDLIVAGDVLVYFGELNPIFKEASLALKAQGLFVFNLEISTSEHYYMTDSGRFAHSEQYLLELAEKNQFRLLENQKVTLRVQNGEEVKGYLIVLEKC